MAILRIKDINGEIHEIPALKGADGSTPEISVGFVETLPTGSRATVTMTGTAANPVLNFGLPRGEQGEKGDKGDKGDYNIPYDFEHGSTDLELGIGDNNILYAEVCCRLGSDLISDYLQIPISSLVSGASYLVYFDVILQEFKWSISMPVGLKPNEVLLYSFKWENNTAKIISEEYKELFFKKKWIGAAGNDLGLVKSGGDVLVNSDGTMAVNKATNISPTSTDEQYPSAKAVWDLFNSIVNGDRGELITKYGVRFEGPENTGSTVQRLYNAVGLVAGVGTDTEAAQNDFDNIYPWSDIRRCCGYWGDDGNFVVNAYKGEPGYAVDGSNGEVWVEIPLFYYKHTYTDGAEEIVISAFKLPGFMPSPINRDQGTEDAPAAKAYYPAYPMATVDGKATSRSGVFSDMHSLNTAMTTARTLGKNYTVTTTAERYTICLLMWVEFATRNMQSVMAGASTMINSSKATVAEDSTNRIIVSTAQAAKFVVGQTIAIGMLQGSTEIANNRIVTAIEDYDDSNKAICFDGDPVNVAVGNVGFSIAWINGSCDNVIASSGSPVSNKSGKYNCMYRGIERPYGGSFEHISDVLFKREGEGTDEDPYTYDIFFLPDPTKYANGAITDDYVKLNYTVPAASGYVKTLGLDSRYPWVRIPNAVGASAATYYSDYYGRPNGELSSGRVGGHWYDNLRVGPYYFFCSGSPSAMSMVYSARLSYHRSMVNGDEVRY